MRLILDDCRRLRSRLSAINQTKQRQPNKPDSSDQPGGESGIRTHGRLPYTRFPSVRLRPLGHLSEILRTSDGRPAMPRVSGRGRAARRLPRLSARRYPRSTHRANHAAPTLCLPYLYLYYRSLRAFSELPIELRTRARLGWDLGNTGGTGSLAGTRLGSEIPDVLEKGRLSRCPTRHSRVVASGSRACRSGRTLFGRLLKPRPRVDDVADR